MKTYKLFESCDEDRMILITEDQILNYHWKHWSSAMRSKGYPEISINPSNCITDFCAVHFASEVLDHVDSE